MKRKLLSIVSAFSLLLFPIRDFAQTPSLGSVANFVLFTTAGAVGNTGISQVTGNVGTGTGAITGFGSLNGVVYNADAATTQGSMDLLSIYNQLNLMIPTSYPSASLGDGEVLTAGVYYIPAAATMDGGLTLDAEGNPNATFIFQIQGAFSTTASSQLNLINGALASNVFWKVEGAVAMATGTIMRGNVIANAGAISLGDGASLEGRALSTTGAVSVYDSQVYINAPVVLSIKLLSFTGVCDQQSVLLNWSTATEINNDYCSIERSIDGNNWQVIDTIDGTGNSLTQRNYSFTDKDPYNNVSYYRLKQTDIDGQFEYFNIIAVKSCIDDLRELSIYPNLKNGILTLLSSGNKDLVRSISIYNVLGEKVYSSGNYQSAIDLSDKQQGIYFIHIDITSENMVKKFVIE